MRLRLFRYSFYLLLIVLTIMTCFGVYLSYEMLEESMSSSLSVFLFTLAMLTADGYCWFGIFRKYEPFNYLFEASSD